MTDVTTPIDEYVRSHTGEPRDGLTKDVAFNRITFDSGMIHNPDQGRIYVGTDGLRISLVQDFRDEDVQRVCTWAINATRGIDPDNPPEPVDWEEMFRGGLQTALEDFRIAFAIHGASRTCTHQVVRTRRAAFHQQSQRAHYYGDLPSVRMPESWLGKEWGGERLPDMFERLAEYAAHVYRTACQAGVSYQDARFALLEGTTNFILWEGSIREFIDTYAYRACSMFQWEISHSFRIMRDLLVEAHPWLAPYIKISCERTHGSKDKVGLCTRCGGTGLLSDYELGARSLSHSTTMAAKRHPCGDCSGTGRTEMPTDGAEAHTCTFQGWEEVDGQCDLPWARETNRAFRSERHAIGRGTR